MMKKNGFTLAEVLITLAIIGVVATLTLPSLMTNTGEQQYITGLKKGINTLTEAAQMNEALLGFNYATLATTSDVNQRDAQSLFGLLANRAAIDYDRTNNGTKHYNTLHTNSSNYAIFFRDGAALIFPKGANSSYQGSQHRPASNMLPDGMPYGISVIYDTNGLKAPNALSNCSANTAMYSDRGGVSDANDIDVCNGSKRIIRDQFGIRLRGSVAVPNGAAAKWAMSN